MFNVGDGTHPWATPSMTAFVFGSRASMRAESAAAAKASGASEAPFCKACPNMEKLGKQNEEGASTSAAVCLGEEGARAQEEVRTRDARRGG